MALLPSHTLYPSAKSSTSLNNVLKTSFVFVSVVLHVWVCSIPCLVPTDAEKGSWEHKKV